MHRTKPQGNRPPVADLRAKFGDLPTQPNMRIFKVSAPPNGVVIKAPNIADKISRDSDIIPELSADVNSLNESKTFQTMAYSQSSRLALSVRANMDMFSAFKRDTEKATPHMSNAWLKGWEIIYRFGRAIVDKCKAENIDTVRVYHVAEFPGSILLAFEQYFHSWGIVNDWRASSYFKAMDNSRNEALKDTYQLYEKHRFRWMMDGVKHQGDMAKTADIRQHLQYYEREGKGLIFSSDLAIGGGEEYNNQEQLNALPHFGAAICALGALEVSPVSFMSLKQFSLATMFSASICSFLASKFDHFYYVKPVTSRPLNSEIYIIGVGFRGIEKSELEQLLAWHEFLGGATTNPSSFVITNWPLDATFMQDHIRAQKSLINTQQINLRYYEKVYKQIAAAGSASDLGREFQLYCNRLKYNVVSAWKATVEFDKVLAK